MSSGSRSGSSSRTCSRDRVAASKSSTSATQMRMAEFIASVSPLIPWHVTAFHKDYRMRDPANTGPETLLRAAAIGEAAGLNYVYAGNLPGLVGRYEDTRCHQCRTPLIERRGYVILNDRLSATGTCPQCGTSIPGMWRQ